MDLGLLLLDITLPTDVDPQVVRSMDPKEILGEARGAKYVGGSTGVPWIFFTSQRFNEYLTASKFNREAKGKAFFRPPMQILAPLRAGPARNRWYPEVRPNPAEDRI